MIQALDRLLQRYVDEGHVAGVTALVTRNLTPIYRGTFGHADLETGAPMRPDAIFRIFSMSKVVTAVAALQLFERGLYRMDDPISRFLPCYHGQQVAQISPSGSVTLTPAERDVTFRDLFTMTSGIPYGGQDGYVPQLMAEVFADIGRKEGTPEAYTTRQVAEAIARAPLSFQPGAHWMYGLSADILGALVEVLSGQTLGDYMQEHIFHPLGMVDTGFTLPEEKQGRLAQIYAAGPQGLTPFDPGDTGMSMTSRFESGGGGLLSTADDYTRFCQMLVMGGTLDGHRVLGRKTVELMRRDHLTPEQRLTYDWETQRGYSYGLLVRTLVDPAAAGSNGSVGEFGWDGMAGTYMCVDPEEQLTCVYLVQRVPGDHAVYLPPFRAAMYAML